MKTREFRELFYLLGGISAVVVLGTSALRLWLPAAVNLGSLCIAIWGICSTTKRIKKERENRGS